MNIAGRQASERDLVSGSNPAWQRFWATGAVDTFGSRVETVLAPESETSPPLFGHWRAWMRALPARGELLDIATGNGVVLSHLLVARPEADWRGLGVDLAEPNPHWLHSVDDSLRERSAFLGQVSAENLPFESGRFWAITSQFGIEYADLNRAVPEAVRVLQPGGSIGWVVHHAQGRPARLAHEELAHLLWLDQVGWLDTVTRAVQQLGGGAPSRHAHSAEPNAHGSDVRSELDRLGHALRARAQQSPCPDLLLDVGNLTVHSLSMANRMEIPRALAQLSTFQHALFENRSRLEDLIAHALDESTWVALLDQLRAQGVTMAPDTGPLSDRGHLMGWWLHGHRT